MVVLVDEKERSMSLRRLRPPPPVTHDIRGMKLHQSSRQQLRPDEFEDAGYATENQNLNPGSPFPPRVSSHRNAGRLAPLDSTRHIANLRRPLSPQSVTSSRYPGRNDQLGFRSASSSVKDYTLNGREPSADPFAF